MRGISICTQRKSKAAYSLAQQNQDAEQPPHGDRQGRKTSKLLIMKKIEMNWMEGIEGGRRISGQGTLDCFNDAYANHGWVSLALMATTYFVPATAIAVAANCAARN
ncbi:hypothetical protein [Niabella ginsengisoli]|uniref:Uncharacterized protein n=1 Tax=Niabella ginsengisoli TaxID=522298 RepID=A0ABS9SIH5_9BACT|nr:hypothetical protein [Niabella ginsengisoli]MCH5598135.1 hypothetical protein [Niabella ginsengisoli]